jgi:cobalt/nickel transport system permease protein
VRTSTKVFVLVGLAMAIVLAVGVSRYASEEPDGLEKVAEEEGFGDAAEEHDLSDSPVADYEPGWSGLFGVAATFAVGAGIFAVVRRRRPDDAERLG